MDTAKQRLFDEIAELEMTGSVNELAENFREYILLQDRLREQIHLDYDLRIKEYVYLLDDYRTAVTRYKRRYKRLQISYITLFLITFFAVLYYLLAVKFGIINLHWFDFLLQ